jgi:hypothetical protein
MTAAEPADRLRMSKNDGHPNLPDDRGAPLVVAEFTLLLRENGDAQEPTVGRFCCWHAGGFTWQLLSGCCLHGLDSGASGKGGIGSRTLPAKRRSAGATSATAAAFGKTPARGGATRATCLTVGGAWKVML